MPTMEKCGLVALIIVLGITFANNARAVDERVIGKGSTAEVQDIINTLKQRGSFHQLLDGLQNGYNLDDELKNKGPYTLFAPDDKAFSKLPEEDRQSLFANRKKINQVLSYHIVKGSHLTSNELASMPSVLSLEGDQIPI